MLRYRQKLIKMRTMSKNSLQSLALQSGIARRSRLFTREGKAELDAAVMSPAMEWQRAHWWELLESLNQQVLETMTGVFRALPQAVERRNDLSHDQEQVRSTLAESDAHSADQ